MKEIEDFLKFYAKIKADFMDGTKDQFQCGAELTKAMNTEYSHIKIECSKELEKIISEQVDAVIEMLEEREAEEVYIVCADRGCSKCQAIINSGARATFAFEGTALH